MFVNMLKAKIHKASATESILEYEGSLGIDLDLMDQVGLFPYERILVVNMTNGERLETYAIPSKRGSKSFCLNGAAARKGQKGDRLIIMAFTSVPTAETKNWAPRKIIMNQDNTVARLEEGCEALQQLG